MYIPIYSHFRFDFLKKNEQVHGHQIFINGCFNGDPHPGNVLLMPDGRLGLVDYGQVKEIPNDAMRKYAMLMKVR